MGSQPVRIPAAGGPIIRGKASSSLVSFCRETPAEAAPAGAARSQPGAQAPGRKLHINGAPAGAKDMIYQSLSVAPTAAISGRQMIRSAAGLAGSSIVFCAT